MEVTIIESPQMTVEIVEDGKSVTILPYGLDPTTHSKALHDALGIDAATLGGHAAAYFSVAGHNHSHNSLTDLTVGDYHTQYALLAGRAGGQTLIGGTGSGDNLWLKSSSHGTKGLIKFGALATSYYDEANDQWVLGAPIMSDLAIGSNVAGHNLSLYATLGTEKITWTDAGWDENAHMWTVAGTPVVITHVADTGHTTALTSTLASSIVAGTTYKVVITYIQVAGTCTYSLGGVTGYPLGTSATPVTITDYLTATSTVQMIITPTATSNIVISSISVKALTDASGDLTVEGNLTAYSPVYLGDRTTIYKGVDPFIHTYYPAGTGATGRNLFVGLRAGNLTMAPNTNSYEASYNTGIGYETLNALTYGYANTALGYLALNRNTFGLINTAIGCESMLLNTEGYNNTAVGYNSLPMNTIGYSNVAIGPYSLGENIDGYFNMAIGPYALGKNVSGYKNVAIGLYSQYENIYSIYNVSIGFEAGRGTSRASFTGSTIIGYRAGYALSSGENNVLIGFQAGSNLTTGGTNIIIGYNISAPAVGTSNYLSLGNIIYGNLSIGNVGIMEAAPIGRHQTLLAVGYPALFGGATIGAYTSCTFPTANKDYVNKTGIGTGTSHVGDLLIVTAGTGATVGCYRIITLISANSVQVDRNIHASGSNIENGSVGIARNVVGIFATDGTNGQRMMNYSAQNKPFQIGGEVLAATGHSLVSKDVLIGGILEADGLIYADAGIDVASGQVYKLNGLQVLGARIIDARIDDAINDAAWDATTAGVLDALRDAAIAHGWIAPTA
jgi:hypothetical protein